MFLTKWNLQEVCFDGCAIGLRARSGELLKKPWRVCTNDQNILTTLRGLTCSNTGNPLSDHVHAECRGVDCKESEKYTFSFTRRVHRAFMKTTQDNVDKLVPICTTSQHNTYELFSCFCSDPTCVCLSQTASETALNFPTTFPSAAAFCCRRTMEGTQLQPTPERMRRFVEKRLPIPRTSAGASQQQDKVTVLQ